MREFETGPGRKLVGVDMGEGYEKYNKPRKALEFLESTLDNLQGQLFDQAAQPGLLTEKERRVL